MLKKQARDLVTMALRSLGRAGVEMGARVAGKGSRGLGGGVSHRTRQLAGAERSLSSSFVGEGQGQFGSSQAPSYRQGASCEACYHFDVDFGVRCEVPGTAKVIR